MTDPTTPDRDELASALLDGEPVDGAPVAQDADIAARADELRQARDAVAADVPPLAPPAADALVAAALGAWDDQQAAEAEPDGDDDDLAVAALAASSGGARTRRRRIWLPAPGIAAAVILVVALFGIALIATDARSNRTDDATAKLSDSDLSHAVGGNSDAAASKAPIEVPQLGTFADQAALTRALGTLASTESAPDPAASTAVGAAPDAGGSTTPPSSPAPATTAVNGAKRSATLTEGAVDRCEEVVRASDVALGGRLAVATATLAGRKVLIYTSPVSPSPTTTVPGSTASTTTPTVRSSSTQTRLTVADAESCQVLFAVQP